MRVVCILVVIWACLALPVAAQTPQVPCDEHVAPVSEIVKLANAVLASQHRLDATAFH